MSKTRLIAAALAALAAAGAFVLLPFSGRATAQGLAPIYTAKGTVKGIDAEIALRPSIFDPLVQFAIAYDATAADSSGGGLSQALASDAYPGSLLTGGAGCGGIPFTVQAAYPVERTCASHRARQDETINRYPPNQQGPIVANTGDLLATAALGRAHGDATLQHVTITPAAGITVRISSLATRSDSVWTGSGVSQQTATVIGDLDIVTSSLTLHVDKLISTAISSSDARRGTADATMTILGATATFGGATHAVTIDNNGIHLGALNGPTPPPQVPLPDNIDQKLSAELGRAIGQAGFDVQTATPTELVDGAQAESSVGGLIITFSTGRPPYPPVPPPPTPLPQLPNQCLNSGPLAGICIGPGLVPIPPGDVAPTIALGAVDSFAVADHGYEITFTPGGGGGGFSGGPTVVGGVHYTPPRVIGGTSPTTPPAVSNPGVLTGLVAKLPSSALAVLGVILSVLAVGLSAGPSLRRT